MIHLRHRRRFVSLVLSATALALTASDGILTAAAASQEAQGDGRVDVLIAFHGKPGPDEDALVRGGGGEIKHRYRLVDAIAARLLSQEDGGAGLSTAGQDAPSDQAAVVAAPAPAMA